MHLDPALLDQMARQGTTFVPTMNVFATKEADIRAKEPTARRDWWLAGWAAAPALVRAAYEAGVQVLAGTDSLPCGTIAAEVGQLAAAGLPGADAVAAASWRARDWLGLPGLVDGAPADLVVYDSDPTLDPRVLAHPRRIVLKGKVVL
jgi:imidazolonepropionase-like amidohydrolase